jgi:hypothetical protein
MVGFLIAAMWAVLLTRPDDFELAGQSLAKCKVILGFLSCVLILIFGDLTAFVILGCAVAAIAAHALLRVNDTQPLDDAEESTESV